MTVRIGFIGAGGNSNWHMDSLAEVADAKVVAVCDLDPAKAKTTAEKWGAKAHTSHKELLAENELDCCYICIPPHQHGEPEIDVIQKGLPFFVEKPLALRMELAEDILERIEKRGINTCVGYQIRYLDICDRARKMLEGRQINAVHAHYTGGCVGGWYTRLALSGGQITEQATHLVDLMRFILGDVEWIAAAKRTGAVVTEDTLDGTTLGKGSVSSEAAGLQLHDYNIWDATAMLMQFESGVPATFICSCQAPYQWDVMFDIWTTEFRLRLSFGGMEIIHVVDGELKTEKMEAVAPKGIDATFVDAVKTGDFSQVRSHYRDAMESLRVTLTAAEAAVKGGVLSVRG